MAWRRAWPTITKSSTNSDRNSQCRQKISASDPIRWSMASRALIIMALVMQGPQRQTRPIATPRAKAMARPPIACQTARLARASTSRRNASRRNSISGCSDPTIGAWQPPGCTSRADATDVVIAVRLDGDQDPALARRGCPTDQAVRIFLGALGRRREQSPDDCRNCASLRLRQIREFCRVCAGERADGAAVALNDFGQAGGVHSTGAPCSRGALRPVLPTSTPAPRPCRPARRRVRLPSYGNGVGGAADEQAFS